MRDIVSKTDMRLFFICYIFLRDIPTFWTSTVISYYFICLKTFSSAFFRFFLDSLVILRPKKYTGSLSQSNPARKVWLSGEHLQPEIRNLYGQNWL